MLENISSLLKASRTAVTCAKVLQKPYLVLRSPDNSSFAVVSAEEIRHLDEPTLRRIAAYHIEEKIEP